MKTMKIVTPELEIFSLPRAVLGQLKTASEAELKVLLYLFANKEAEVPELCAQLGIRPAEAETAVAFWRGAGIFQEDTNAPKKPVAPSTGLFKSYDSQTIKEKLDDPKFKLCCELVAEKLEKAQLTKNDLSSLVYLYDYVGLSPEMISGVAAYAASRGKKSMQYLMTTALKMYQEDGIDTYEKFEKHLARLEQLQSDIGRVTRMCGYGDRELSSKESAYLKRWFSDWGFTFDVVKLAYERTVDNLGHVRLSYMNTILGRWYDSGWMTPEAIEASDKKPASAGAAGYGDVDAFYEAALTAGFEDPVKPKEEDPK